MAPADDADDWLYELTVDEAARRRAERHDLQQLRGEARSLLEAIGAMAAEGRSVVLRVAGAPVTGAVITVGEGLVEMQVDDGRLLVAAAAIDTVEAAAPLTAAARDVAHAPADLRERLRLMQGEGRTVTLTLRDGSVLAGRLDTVGADTVLIDRRPERPPAYVALGSLALVSGYR